MAIFTDVPAEILAMIVEEVASTSTDELFSSFEPSPIYSLVHVNQACRTLCLNVYFGVDSSLWSERKKKRKLVKMARHEAKLVAFLLVFKVRRQATHHDKLMIVKEIHE